MKELCVLSPAAALGGGFPEAGFAEGMRRGPDVIAIDAGSAACAPYDLGSGCPSADRGAVLRDLSYIIPAALKAKIPVVIGSAGGAGAAPHLQWLLDIIEELAFMRGVSFKTASVSADISRVQVLESLHGGKVAPFGSAPGLTGRGVGDSVRIVGQMGVEPLIKALETGADVIAAGRAYGSAVFAALAVAKGYDRGLATHMGKVLGRAAAAEPGGSMIGYIGEGYFRVEALSPLCECTVKSVAAHTLYAETDPYALPGPGGAVDLSGAAFTQEGEGRVKVTGSVFRPSHPYLIKLEGVRKRGFRTVSVASAADPVMIPQIDGILDAIREKAKSHFAGVIDGFSLGFKAYGQNAAAGMFSDRGCPAAQQPPAPRELCIIIDAVAPSQEQAGAVCAFARFELLHCGYAGKTHGAGNLAFPFVPSDFRAGEVFEFSVNHLMEASGPCGCFHMEIKEVGGL